VHPPVPVTTTVVAELMGAFTCHVWAPFYTLHHKEAFPALLELVVILQHPQHLVLASGILPMCRAHALTTVLRFAFLTVQVSLMLENTELLGASGASALSAKLYFLQMGFHFQVLFLLLVGEGGEDATVRSQWFCALVMRAFNYREIIFYFM
jgi:hypothetical protein